MLLITSVLVNIMEVKLYEVTVYALYDSVINDISTTLTVKSLLSYLYIYIYSYMCMYNEHSCTILSGTIYIHVHSTFLYWLIRLQRLFLSYCSNNYWSSILAVSLSKSSTRSYNTNYCISLTMQQAVRHPGLQATNYWSAQAKTISYQLF